MAVMGSLAAMTAQAAHVRGASGTSQFLAANFVDIAGFLLLLGWGISLRKNAAAHKRVMILSTISLADPGFGRLSGHLLQVNPTGAVTWFFCFFYGNVLLIALMAGWDWWRGRLVRQFVVGAAGLLAAEFGAALLYFWKPWVLMSHGWVEAWARMTG